ncbi:MULTISPECIES: hypothetical protein [Maribacter]|uniref:Uncharacterized protein n=1 Tax=Maribacter dokdonensis TaxID=320912 RepID=A0A1H4N839_9FLAO|nr:MULTISPECIES: hypothetical protein [Maribacter]KSA14947.1 hypothetical protein I600_1553 [Maribacter dokdonensis DSW-8]PHN94313.1 hypothetical protein CSC80_02870 [Maribacter sp. 6B07]SDT06250.1 hypothetical protein SAMN05192545_2675 [Maribacter dokdonensis]SEB91469.1 hypothetical protein SAMN05192540_1878 [Maribacter dokdonensis]|tara:strand:+ start:9736 stop:10482 length:747 start_codon:yes stop_codon:yes gene_type:complete
MRKILMLAITAIVSTTLQAQYSGQVPTNMGGASQNAAAGAAIANFLGPVNEAYQKRREIDLDKFQGSPYTSNTFAPTILKYNDEVVGNIYYRYNALNEEIEIKKTSSEDEPYKALVKDKEVSLLINAKPLSFKTFVTEKNETINGYLTLLQKGNTYDLYQRTLVKFTEGQPAQNSFVAAVPSRFTKFTEYYFQKDGVNRIDQIPQKNKKLLKLIDASKREDLKIFLKENNLNIKNEQDLAKVFDYLNS